MQYASIGSSELKASRIWFGAWATGGWNWGGSDEKKSIRAIHAALAAGVNAIDTAPIYGFGRSEEIIGRAVIGRRNDIIIATKFGLNWQTDQGCAAFRSTREMIDREHGNIVVRTYLSPSFLRTELENSLRRLKIGTIDLYQLHYPDRSTPIEDIMAELLAMKDEGKIRAIGMCNLNSARLERCRAIGEIVSAQQHYSMLDRRAGKDIRAWCVRNGASLMAYSPMECGLLTCRYSPDHKFPRGDYRATMPLFRSERIGRLEIVFNTLQKIAEDHGSTAAQVSLAWTLAQEGVGYVLAGIRDEKQALENAAAADLVLTDHQLARVDTSVDKYIRIEREAGDMQ